MRSIPVLVAGGGASGMVAAIEAAKLGANVTVIEKKNKPGKKILATGNGRCNFTNRNQEISCYHSSDDTLVQMVLQRFDHQKVIDYFWESGVMSKERDGYYYPLSGQAASVRAMLEREMDRYKVEVHCDETLQRIIPRKDLSGQNITGYEVQTDRDKYLVRKLILAVGGSAAPAQGIMGQVELWCEGSRLAEDIGEIQMVAKGISGIPVFQISGRVSRLLYQGKEPYLKIDVMPDHTKEQVMEELLRRVNTYGVGRSLGDVLDGMLPDKLAKALLLALHKSPGDGAEILQEDRWRNDLADQIKGKKLHIRKVSDFDKAQVTTGGVALSELQADTLELIKYPGIYVTGELADVDGICGGYNLQWAWSSGHLAGQSAACALKTKIRSRS